MTTKRTPIYRPLRRQITAEAVRLFRLMKRIECSCSSRDWKGEYWRHTPCEGCERWWRLHSSLHRELCLPPHHWPAIENPEATCPYPDGCEAARRWTPNERARGVYRELETADRAERRRAKPMRPATPARAREEP
jgi:hypothetical protein